MGLGVRHDGGDAETGWGVDVAGGVALSAPAPRPRGLARRAGGSDPRGGGAAGPGDLGGAVPGSAAGGRAGPDAHAEPDRGRGRDALLARETLEGLAANDSGDGLGRRRLEARFGYGFALFGGRFTGTPEIALGLSDAGRDYGLGWRLARAGSGPGALGLALEATRRESANDNADPEHDIGVRVTARW